MLDILELTHTTGALKWLDDDEKMTINNVDSHSGKRGGAQWMWVINEPGLYKLIANSHKPQAKAFDRWVRHEVLPKLRTEGGYAVPGSGRLMRIGSPFTSNGHGWSWAQDVISIPFVLSLFLK